MRRRSLHGIRATFVAGRTLAAPPILHKTNSALSRADHPPSIPNWECPIQTGISCVPYGLPANPPRADQNSCGPLRDRGLGRTVDHLPLQRACLPRPFSARVSGFQPSSKFKRDRDRLKWLSGHHATTNGLHHPGRHVALIDQKRRLVG